MDGSERVVKGVDPEATPVARAAAAVERAFEAVLWSCRYAVLIAVVASLLISFGMFYSTTVDSYHHLIRVAQYSDRVREGAGDSMQGLSGTQQTEGQGERSHEKERSEAIADVVEAIDGYLLATVMLIFAFGLYELFISRIEITEGRGRASRILLIQSLDDLKHRLGQVILLILVVKYFEHALRLEFDTPLTLFWLATGILLIAVALYLTHRRHTSPDEGGLSTDEERSPESHGRIVNVR